MLPAFLRGGTVFFMDKYPPERFVEQVRAHGITCSSLVPSQIYGLLGSPALQPHALAGAQVQEREPIDFVAQRKGVVCAPKRIGFEAELPLTSVGKVDKKALRAWYWTGRGKPIARGSGRASDRCAKGARP